MRFLLALLITFVHMRFPDRPCGVPLYGKTRRIWKVARSSRKFAYGGIRSEIRAFTAVPGPLISGIRTDVCPGRILAKKCWNDLTLWNFGPGTAIIGPRKAPSFRGGFTCHYIAKKDSFTAVFQLEIIFRWQLCWKSLTLFCNGTSFAVGGVPIHRPQSLTKSLVLFFHFGTSIESHGVGDYIGVIFVEGVFLFFVNGGSSRLGRACSYVNDVCSLVEHALGCHCYGFGQESTRSCIEGLLRDVQDAHHQGFV